MGVEQIEPALTPPTIKPVLPKKAKLGSGKSKTRKRDIPEGLWTKCPVVRNDDLTTRNWTKI